MPLCHDVSKQIKELIKLDCRSLIMIDNVLKDPPSWCLFTQDYEVKDTFISEDQFLTTKMQLGSASGVTIYTNSQFPIFNDIGHCKVTVIIRNRNGTITCKNGESCPTALLMGLE